MSDSVRVRLFGGARETAATGAITVLVGESGTTAADVLRAVLRELPALVPHAASLRIAVNDVLASGQDPVVPGDEVSVLPPFAGG